LGIAIPDGNPAGITRSLTFNNAPTDLISRVDVSLNISGGFNGDLYGYLVLQSADNSTTTAILLNRVGRTGAADYGFSTATMSVTLSGDTTQGYSNIHGIQFPGAGPYLADGRTNSPLGDFTASTSTQGLDVLNGKNANGTWTLFLADVSGGSQSTLETWGLSVSVVPEPTTWAILFFGAVVVGQLVYRRLFRRQS
jgi:subtilisin-like proprotein convertase family protein